jgi:hypothetical protein
MMSAAPAAGAAAALRGRARRPDYRPLLAALDTPRSSWPGQPNLEAEAAFNEARPRGASGTL